MLILFIWPISSLIIILKVVFLNMTRVYSIFFLVVFHYVVIPQLTFHLAIDDHLGHFQFGMVTNLLRIST